MLLFVEPGKTFRGLTILPFDAIISDMRLCVFITAVCILFCAACATGNKTLKCNLHVIKEMSTRRIYLPDANANELDAYLKSSKDWRLIPKKNNKLDHGSAYKSAKAGGSVLASYPGKRNGHIVVVYGRKKPEWSNSWKADLPYVSGSRMGEKVKIKLLSYQFSKDKEPRINYFVYIKR